jgi:hemolysin III
VSAPAIDEVTDSPLAPLLRGVMHQWATALALSLSIVLVMLAGSTRPRISAIVYGIGLVSCLGVSAVYHRGRWSRRMKARMCKLDHSTIFLLIAGTSTPIVLLTLHGTFGASLLLVEWVGAVCGIGIAVLWRKPPVWAEVGPYLLLGWIGLLAIPGLALHLGPMGVILLAGGGALYSVGAVMYALERPNPWPSVFGFHEVFHVFVTAAAGTHAVLISLLVLSA